MTLTIPIFIQELNDFAPAAENTVTAIESNADESAEKLLIFSERMKVFQKHALQLSLPDIAKIAVLADEIAVKAPQAASRAQLRKCAGSLWDALTSMRFFLLCHLSGENEEETLAILMNRLRKNIQTLDTGNRA